MDTVLTGLARMRLSLHAVHTWDVAVALDPKATLAPDATALLVDTLDQVVARSAKPDGTARSIHVSTTGPQRDFALELGESVTLVASGKHEGGPEIALPAEALIRLAYGRLDPAHTPTISTEGLDINELRAIFPGF